MSVTRTTFTISFGVTIDACAVLLRSSLREPLLVDESKEYANARVRSA